ncbi:MAG: hypothetical protein A3F74_18105 [Betaproteobacteria bacterium RIFCSPLOWO2_12_FULL_62_58]|nr:MAG: hypothetical protein A3F74_18105 [Betaproteobacteria bacterium RIFCSPLOWO2_12_FULL_62_58]
MKLLSLGAIAWQVLRSNISILFGTFRKTRRGILKLMQMEDMSRTSHGMISKALLLTHGVGLQKCFGFAETKILSPL